MTQTTILLWTLGALAALWVFRLIQPTVLCVLLAVAVALEGPEE